MDNSPYVSLLIDNTIHTMVFTK